MAVKALTRRTVGGAIAVGLVLTLGGLAMSSARHATAVEETGPPDGQFVRVDGVRLHYIQAGAGPTVLLLHGSPGTVEDFRRVHPGKQAIFEDLARDHTVIALHRPGYGWSEQEGGDPTPLARQADLVALFLRSIGVESALFVGHSYGGGLSLATAVRHPEVVRGLVLLGSVSHDGLHVPSLLTRLQTWPLLGPLFRWAVAPVLVEPLMGRAIDRLFTPEGAPPGYPALLLPLLKRPSTLYQRAFELAGIDRDFAPLVSDYPKIRVPTTVLVGEEEGDDLATASKLLAEAIPNARTVRIPGVGHQIPHLRPRAVIEAVRAMFP
jgi:pimeloyl-ACP methyl ester carboxylesterase